MRIASQVFPRQFGRQPAITLALVTFAVIVAFRVAGYIVAEDFVDLAYVGITFIGAAFLIAILRDWRNGLYFFLVWLLFEDLARKFLGNNMAIYFAKDGLLLIVYLAFFAAYRRKESGLQTFRPPFLIPLVAIVWFSVMQVFNPASPTIFFGLLGIKVYFYYVPLLAVGYAMINSEADLRKFFHINLGFMVVIIALGVVQAVLGHKFLNPEVPAEDIRLLSQTYREAPISGVIVYRPTSVFVSAGRFQDLVIVAWLLVLGFSGYLLLRHRRGRTFAFLALALTASACVMCSSRGVFMWSAGSGIVGTVAFLWGAPWRQGEARHVFRFINRGVLGIALGVIILLLAYPDAFLNRLSVYSETLDPRSPASELLHRTRDYPLANFLAAFTYDRWPIGYGIGTLTLGGQYVSRFLQVRSPVNGVESGFGVLVIEMGIGGLILWVTLAAAILIAAWRVVRKLKGSPWFPLAFMIFWYALLLLVPLTFQGMQAYQDFILNAYLWLLLGILFRLPKLALEAQIESVAARSGSQWIS
jgi:hypothetical protein